MAQQLAETNAAVGGFQTEMRISVSPVSQELLGRTRELNAANAVSSNNAFDISGIKQEGLADKWHIVEREEQSLTLHTSQKNMCVIQLDPHEVYRHCKWSLGAMLLVKEECKRTRGGAGSVEGG